ncbi:MAG: T9SS type A sorting domain-containing protein [bacterium]|nr:T9SS type A sorting domain-containing protein [bacterium]
MSWTTAGPYDFWFAAECVPSNSAEEFLCYNRGRRVFDVLDAADGHSYGVTDTIDIATSGARIIGRYDSTFRRLVIRDSTSLKLYRFGEYLAADEPPVPIPSDLRLAAYPNPFNPSATIRFSLPRRGEAELVVYDVTGREVSVLVDGVLVAGEHRVPFDGARLPSGIYFARLTAAGAQATQKLLLLK